MAQHAALQIRLAAEGVDQRVAVLGDGVDGEVAAGEVLRQRHASRLPGEALVARAGFALGAGERVLLAGPRMQEDWKVAPDLPKAALLHLFWRGAHNHPIALAYRSAQQFVAHRAANEIGLHAAPGRSRGAAGTRK